MFTCSFIRQVTLSRNPNGSEYDFSKLSFKEKAAVSLSRVALAEVGYIIAIPFAVVETALSAIGLLFSFVNWLVTDDNEYPNLSMESLVNSSCCIVWALSNALINPFANDMIVHADNAWKSLLEGSPFNVPKDLVGNPRY